MCKQSDRFIKERDYGEYGWRIWKRLGKSKSQKEADAYAFLAKQGLPAPRVYRVEDKRNALGILTYSRLEIEQLDAVDLRYIMYQDEYLPLRSNRVWRRALIERLAQDLRLMHEHRFFHLNLNFRNIMVVPDVDRIPPTIYYIDATSARFSPFSWELYHCLVKELAFLYRDSRPFFSHTERLHFLHCYLGRDRLTPSDKAFAAAIVRYTKKKWGDKVSTL